MIAPSFESEAISILQEKKNRIILQQNDIELPNMQVRTCLNGLLVQERNNVTDNKLALKNVTTTEPTNQEIEDLIFASKICKNTKIEYNCFGKKCYISSIGNRTNFES